MMMWNLGLGVVRRSLAIVLFAVCICAARGAQAAPFQLIYTGAFNTSEALNLATASSPTFFTGLTPFTIRALFDTSSPNLAPPLPGPFAGFRAYAPSSATLDVLGMHFTIESILQNPLAGITVAIFDQNSFTPLRYGVGFIADPINDGAGLVADFMSASPGFTVNALKPTVFTDFVGVGYGSGVCTSGTAPACPHLVTPWVLRDASNTPWNLTLGNYSLDFPAEPLNTAQILAADPVPEPSTGGLMLLGIAALAWARRRGVLG